MSDSFASRFMTPEEKQAMVARDPQAAQALHNGPRTGVGAHPLVPDLRNRILRIKDGAGNDLEIHQVYIPLFYSEGFSDPNLNGIECGGFWIDPHYPAMMQAFERSTGLPYPAGLAVITDRLFEEDPHADER